MSDIIFLFNHANFLKRQKRYRALEENIVILIHQGITTTSISCCKLKIEDIKSLKKYVPKTSLHTQTDTLQKALDPRHTKLPNLSCL